MAERPVLDPYAVLGVPRDATALQVARAHRRLAKRYHPDLNPGDGDGDDVTERMRRINEAYRLLASSARRAEFDHANPAAGTRSSGHWAASRRPIHPAPPTSSRTWAAWRTTADETRAAPRVRRNPGEVQTPVTRRPPRLEPVQRTFLDTGWAALIAAAVLLALLAAAIAAGRLT